jgi:hypothetical protein
VLFESFVMRVAFEGIFMLPAFVACRRAACHHRDLPRHGVITWRVMITGRVITWRVNTYRVRDVITYVFVEPRRWPARSPASRPGVRLGLRRRMTRTAVPSDGDRRAGVSRK